MNDMTANWFETCITELTPTAPQRIWSVLVTIFGDLAQDESDQISGALMGRLTGLAGIKSEATRVALHRLRKEGWIESRRIGRGSVHKLTAYGRQHSAAAAPRIYARETEQPELWHVLIAATSETSREELGDLLQRGSYICVTPTLAIAPGPVPEGLKEVLGLQSDNVAGPKWLRDLCGAHDIKAAYDAFSTVMTRIEALLPAEGGRDPIQIAVLRVLIVHNWRRILLRHPALPAAFLPENWPEAACRDKVARVLERLPKPSLQTLERQL